MRRDRSCRSTDIAPTLSLRWRILWQSYAAPPACAAPYRRACRFRTEDLFQCPPRGVSICPSQARLRASARLGCPTLPRALAGSTGSLLPLATASRSCWAILRGASQTVETRNSGASGHPSWTMSAFSWTSRWRDAARRTRQTSSSPQISSLMKLMRRPVAAARW
jgi:hypothetical protein